MPVQAGTAPETLLPPVDTLQVDFLRDRLTHGLLEPIVERLVVSELLERPIPFRLGLHTLAAYIRLHLDFLLYRARRLLLRRDPVFFFYDFAENLFLYL